MTSEKSSIKKALLVTIPHSGERVPPETPWLAALPEPLLMCDVDRYVDWLYEPVLQKLKQPYVKTEWHRYAADLNRWKDDVDADSVQGHANPSGKFPRGLHWSITTKGERLMPGPMEKPVHDRIVENYFEPFHRDVRGWFAQIKESGTDRVFHLDLHSMPSVGTKEHRDPGERRADIVVSDSDGKSCSSWLKDLVIDAYKAQGFNVAYNWPYKGGRVTETYGKPHEGQESIQIELNRALYMDEETKKLIPEKANPLRVRLAAAIERIFAAVPAIRTS